jgi:hypothetical protein
MTQVLIDTGLPCFDDVLAKYAFTRIEPLESISRFVDFLN